MQNFSSILSSKEINDDELFSQITAALQEESSVWNTQNDFIEPGVIENFQNKWSSAYYTAKKKTAKLSFPLGLFRRKNDNTALRFIEVYEQMPQKLRQYNDRVATEKAVAAAKLILPVEGKQLDVQQMHCITKEVRNHLVLAGAGTGKTTTIVGYVKYLLKSGTCKPEDILVLSFTNASAAEMSQRLTAELGASVTASTFHKLGLDIITSVQGKKPKIYSA
ncbi:MAG: UvrD-helicase domain-containing protein, partial [Hungatella sp.]|nr:UvrD-helicase domain-containing protein [Hungatella sp.]